MAVRISRLQRIPSVGEETPALEAYPDPPSGSELNPMLIFEPPAHIEEDECDLWFLPVLEQRGKNEEVELGVLGCHELHHSAISVASSPASCEPMSGTRDQPTLVQEAPVPRYMVDDYQVPQYIVVEKAPMPISGFKHGQCLVVESPLGSTGHRAGTKSLLPMCGTINQPSLVDHSPAVPKATIYAWGERIRWREVPQPSQ